MKTQSLTVVFFLLANTAVPAATSYVWQNSPNPAPPFATWLSAAHTIQEAVDVAGNGDEIVVTNGTYATGARAAARGVLLNRVAVEKPVLLRSVNGAQFTFIEGYQVPGTTNGNSAIRCAWLGTGAYLSGFTLTNGATRLSDDNDGAGGGVFCERGNTVVSNCVLITNSAGQSGGGACLGFLYDCTIKGNSAISGGGACGSVLNNCSLFGNSANEGGGASNCLLTNCTLTANAAVEGGGAWLATLQGCALTANSAYQGGGAVASDLFNCTVTGNRAEIGGGCAGVLVSFTCCEPSPTPCVLNNCVIYFNEAPIGPNFYDSLLNYCCTTPLPASGIGNIQADPQLTSPVYLGAASPCRGAGSAVYATGVDIDNEPWANPPSMGCDEYSGRASTGLLSAALTAPFTNVAVGYPLQITALIEGRPTLTVWHFGDGVALTNQPSVLHAWRAAGDYFVVLKVYNDAKPEATAVQMAVRVLQAECYVAADNAHPLPPYNSWETAANTIQDAVDAAAVGGIVRVTNGVYATAGRVVAPHLLTNRVAVTKPLTVSSVNGPEFTTISGYQVPAVTNGDSAIRCVYLGKGGRLSGFTLMYGATRASGGEAPDCSGGGFWCESLGCAVSNCVLKSNAATSGGGGAYAGTLNNCRLLANAALVGGGAETAVLNDCVLAANTATSGGGAWNCTLNRCALSGNSADSTGGGAYYSKLNNCALTANMARFGGGVAASDLTNCTVAGNTATAAGGGAYTSSFSWSSLQNCILYYNNAPEHANYFEDGESFFWNSCCTVPLPAAGLGNISASPLFLDYPGGNLRLQSNSPCINAGNSASVIGVTDLDGQPRVVSGTVDIGACEYQGPGSVISYAWLEHYGLRADGSSDHADPDNDGMDNWQEWRCQTDPTNALSRLRLFLPLLTTSNLTVSWTSVNGLRYCLERSTNLSSSPTFFPLATNIAGQPGITTCGDTNASTKSTLFYRVGVP